MTAAVLDPPATDADLAARVDAVLAEVRAAILESDGVTDLQFAVVPPRPLGGRRHLGQCQIWWAVQPEGR